MFRRYVLLTLRKFSRNKTSFLINLIGLSTGLAAALIILLWVSDELAVDQFHENRDQLYEVFINAELPNGIQTRYETPGPLANALIDELPEVEAATSYHNTFLSPQGILLNEDRKMEVNGIYAKPNFFEIFSHPLIEGTQSNALKDKNGIVLTEKMAINLFGSAAKAMGKSVNWQNDYFDELFVVSGVIKNPPTNASNQFDAIIQYEWLIDITRYADDWSGAYAKTALLLKDGTDLSNFNQKLTALYYSKREGFEKPRKLFAAKYANQYLYGNYEDGIQAGGRIEYVRFFSLIALFILVLACINFMNLSSAQANYKMKTIGVKKTIGAQRKTLIIEILAESTILTLIGLTFALALVHTVVPQFNNLTGKSLQLLFNPYLLLMIIGVGLFTGLFAGSYPAFYLSSIRPIKMLRGHVTQEANKSKWLRKSLVVFQFGLSLVFMVGVLVIQQQMNYINTKPLGYERENVISFQRIQNDGDPQVFLSELRKLPGVINAANMASSITQRFDNQSGYSWRGQEEDKKILFEAPRIGYEAIETLNIELLAGRTFSKDLQDDDSKIILNESAVKLMNLDNPVGALIENGSGMFSENQEVIGIVKDFHYGSIHKKIEPMILRFRPDEKTVIARLQAGTGQGTIAQIEELYTKFHPNYAFNYSFLDLEYESLYTSESQVASLAKYFSALAILISCLGLFGLAVFTTERRQKEISIRKVLGASVFGIVKILSRDFGITVCMAIILSIPISLLIVQNWLAGFAYSIQLNPWYFIIPSALILLISYLTVSIQTLQAARHSPIHHLKDE